VYVYNSRAASWSKGTHCRSGIPSNRSHAV